MANFDRNFRHKPVVPHVPLVYRVAATGLGASMWFFVRLSQVRLWMGFLSLTSGETVDVQSEERRYDQLTAGTDFTQSWPLTFVCYLTGPVLFGFKHPWDH